MTEAHETAEDGASLDQCDLVVIGAGPAGLAAAQTAAEQGLHVRLIDEQPVAGGQIWRNAAHVVTQRGPLVKSVSGAQYAIAAMSRAGVVHSPAATVLDAAVLPFSENPKSTGVRISWLATQGRRGIRETTARALVIATGAMERPVLFPGAALPGVMGVGAVQSVMKQSGMVPSGGGVILAGQGPLLLLTMCQILDLGGTVDAVLDVAPKGALAGAATGALAALWADPKLMAQGASLLWRARRSGVRWYNDVRSLHAVGEDGIQEVAFEAAGKAMRLPCSLLAVHDGVIPNTQLTRLLILDHVWSAAQQAFKPRCTSEGRTSAPSVWVAGDGAGIAGVEVARLRGSLVGLDVAQSLGAMDGANLRARADVLAKQISRRVPARAFVDRLYASLPVAALVGGAEAKEDTLVCRCEAVSLARVEAVIADGATGPNRVKTFTRCGMGSCQGRMCSNALTRIVAEATGSTHDQTGALRIRPPLKPTLISDYLDPVSGSDPASDGEPSV